METEGRRVAQGIQERSVSTHHALLEGAGRVFSRMSYAESRLKDVAAEAGVSQGSLYFHFGNKADIARAVLRVQQERMIDALTDVLSGSEPGLERLLLLGDRLAALIMSDGIVQAGIKLGSQLGTGFETTAREPYFEWVRIAKTLIERGIEDGSVRSSVDAEAAAQYVNSLFVGAQVLSELDSGWQSLATRLNNVGPFIVASLAAPGYRGRDRAE